MRDEVTYVIRDPVNFETHAFSVADYTVLIGFNGDRTLGECFETLNARGVCTSENEESYYRFVLDLHRSGLLSLPISDDKQLYARHERSQAARRRGRWMAAMYLKIPVWNPDAFLARTAHRMAWMFTRGAFVAWLVFAMVCAVVLTSRWERVGEQLPALLAGEQLLSMWVLLAAMKVVHEFGHGYAVRCFGGAVPEMGISLVMLTPCAYVDASSSWGFQSRTRRIIVCLAGMYFESIVAGVALLVWAFTDAGTMHALAYQAMVLASVTTVAFNLNPLMRYDGYYVLSDLLQVPNLRAVAIANVQRIAKRVTLGIDAGGSTWSPIMSLTLCIYAIAATLFRISTVLGICAVIALKLFFVGIAAGLLYGGSVVFGFVTKALRYLWFDKETAPVRMRAIVVGALLVAGPLSLIAIPLPQTIRTEAILGREHEDHIAVVEPGTLVRIARAVGSTVRAGEAIVELASIDAQQSLRESNARLHAADVEEDVARAASAADGEVASRRHAAATAEMNTAVERVNDLVLRSPRDGEIAVTLADADADRPLRAGMSVATVVSGGWIATAVLDQMSIAGLGHDLDGRVEMRSVAEPSCVLHGHIRDISPAGSTSLEHRALTVPGGGAIPVSPIDGTAESRHFKVEIELDPRTDASLLRRGLRVEVNMPGQNESYARRWYRALLWFNEQLRASH